MPTPMPRSSISRRERGKTPVHLTTWKRFSCRGNPVFMQNLRKIVGWKWWALALKRAPSHCPSRGSQRDALIGDLNAARDMGGVPRSPENETGERALTLTFVLVASAIFLALASLDGMISSETCLHGSI